MICWASFLVQLTLYCLGVYSYVLGIFIPPFMSRAFEPIIIHFYLHQLLACRSQLHNKGMATRTSSFKQTSRRSSGHKSKVIKLRKLVKILFSLNSYDKLDVELISKYTYMYKIGKHTHETLISF